MTLILFIIFAVVIFGIVILFSIINGISSLFRKPAFDRNERRTNYTSSSDHTNTSRDNHPHKKVFSKDEGEYVSYEEIKD